MKSVVFVLFVFSGLFWLSTGTPETESAELLDLQLKYEKGNKEEIRILTPIIIKKAEGEELSPEMRSFIALLKYKTRQNEK